MKIRYWLAICLFSLATSAYAQELEQGQPQETQEAKDNTENKDRQVLKDDLRPTLIVIQVTASQVAEMREFIKQGQEFLKWYEINGNRPAYGTFTKFADRKKRPRTPDWLLVTCEKLAIDEEYEDDLLNRACVVQSKLNAELGEDPLAEQIRRQFLKTEQVPHNSFFKHFHIDGPYTVSAIGDGGGTGIYGTIGAHYTIVDTHRLQIFGPPGFLFITMPNDEGEREWKPAFTWGFSVKLFEFNLPHGGPRTNLHLNLVKVWYLGSGDSQLAARSGMDMVGFSYTFK